MLGFFLGGRLFFFFLLFFFLFFRLFIMGLGGFLLGGDHLFFADHQLVIAHPELVAFIQDVHLPGTQLLLLEVDVVARGHVVHAQEIVLGFENAVDRSDADAVQGQVVVLGLTDGQAFPNGNPMRRFTGRANFEVEGGTLLFGHVHTWPPVWSGRS